MFLGTAKDKVIKKIREYSNSGNLISRSKNLDYLLPMNTYFDTAQKMVSKQKKINAREDIVQAVVSNLFGETFTTEYHRTEDVTKALDGTANAYSLDVTSTSTVYIEEETATDVWTILVTINNTGSNDFTTYTGLLTPSDSDNAVRIRFSGSYFYAYRNWALYEEKFPTVAEVPTYSAWQPHPLPTTFYQIDKVMLSETEELDPTQYKFIEDGSTKTILFPYKAEGEFQVLYFKLPDDIPNDDNDDTLYDDTYEFELDDEAIEVMILHVCYITISDEDEYRAGQFLEQYYVEYNDLESESVTGTESVTDNYGWV